VSHHRDPPTSQRPRTRLSQRLVQVSRQLSREVRGLEFGSPAAFVYNPLDYARAPHEAYLHRYGNRQVRVVLVGMNPGPFGMAQTGVPFGDVAMVRDWLGIAAHVGTPASQHPKRPIVGFRCTRREVSGSRLWGWAKASFGTPELFFAECFVINYCPLVFMDDSGRNITPDRLRPGERQPLFDACDGAVRQVLAALRPASVVGIGRFATDRLRQALTAEGLPIRTLIHPSPANPRAAANFAREATECLGKCGVKLPSTAPG